MFSIQILLPILMTLCTFYFTASALPYTILFSCDGKVLRGGDGEDIVHTSKRDFKIRIQKPAQQEGKEEKQKEEETTKKKVYEKYDTRLYWTKTLKGIAAPYNPDTLDRATAEIGIILYTKIQNESTIFDKVTGEFDIEINLEPEELNGLPQKDMSGVKKLETSATANAWVKLNCVLQDNKLLDITKKVEYKTASCKRVSGSQKLGWGFILV